MRRGTAGTRTAETLPGTEGRSENTKPECDESAPLQVLLNLVKSGGTPLKFLEYQCENVTQLMRLPSPHLENIVSSPWKHSGSQKRSDLRKNKKLPSTITAQSLGYSELLALRPFQIRFVGLFFPLYLFVTEETKRQKRQRVLRLVINEL